MAASTSTAVPSTQDEDISLLRAVLGRTSQEVKDYTVQYEDKVNLVQQLGLTVNKPENKPGLDILAMRERRLDAALDREANAIEKLIEFCVADKSASHAQSVAATAAFPPPSGVGAATTTTTVPSKALGASVKKIMKRKLPEPVDGWKDQYGKTHRVHHDHSVYHKTVSSIFWQIMDIVHEQSSNGSGEPTPDVLLARLVPL
jgi:hypothetical protein